MALELAQQMRKVTAAQAATASAAAAAAEQDLRQVTGKMDNTAGHNSSGAGLVQAAQGKDELQEYKGSRQQAAQEPYKAPVRAEAATGELERVRGRAEEAKTEPEKLVQSAASSGQQKALRLPIGMAGPASAVFGHNDKIRLQYVTQSCRWAEQPQGSRQDALHSFMANILYCLFSSRDGILHAGCIVTSSLGCDSHVCASLQVLLCIAICVLSTHTSTSFTVCCGGRALALHKARPWRHINNSALLPVGILNLQTPKDMVEHWPGRLPCSVAGSNVTHNLR